MRMTGLKMGRGGLTLVELIIAMAILSVLAAAVLPLAEVTVRRSNELELRRSLRLVRTAIDQYKADFDRAVLEKKIISSINETGYPKELDDLVKGADFGGLYPFKRKYLRRIPRDPFDTFDEGWELRAYADPPDATVYGGGDIYDVYSRSTGIGIDGTPYREW
jgi:general secretion pathway protein G